MPETVNERSNFAVPAAVEPVNLPLTRMLNCAGMPATPPGPTYDQVNVLSAAIGTTLVPKFSGPKIDTRFGGWHDWFTELMRKFVNATPPVRTSKTICSFCEVVPA